MPNPTPPKRKPPGKSWEHYSLWERTQEVLRELPQHFRSTISVSGINATEIFTFGQVLSATIEERESWDPEEGYEDYTFFRQAEGFPDVLFEHPRTEEGVFGIELKSWYLLAKEGEPSFRFQADPKACDEQDLLVVVPWALSNVLAGTPLVFQPYIELARYVAEYRNYWWQHIRDAKGDTTIKRPRGVSPYPRSREEIVDKPVEDKGNNFGRIARIELMDDYVRSFDDMFLLGIRLSAWRKFFKEGVGETQRNTLNQLGINPEL